MTPCPTCGLTGGFHEEDVHSRPLPEHLRHLVHPEREEPTRRERPSDEEIARLRAEKLARRATA